MLTSPARVVVAIPALNEARAIEGVIRTLASEQPSLPTLQIVVADGGSSDGTPAIVTRLAREFPFVHLLDNCKVIQSAGVNRVAERYAGAADILVRCDAHAVYPAHFIKSLVMTLHRMDADSVVVPMDSTGRTAFEKALAWVSDTPVGSGGSGHRGGCCSGFVDHGHHAAFRLDAFLAAGGYDEGYRQNEDAEFDSRLNALGGRVFLDAAIRIGYHPRSGFRSLWRQYFGYGVGRSRTVRRHPATLRLRQFAVPFHLVLSAVSLVLAVATRNWLFLAWPLFYVLVLTLTAVMLAQRKHSLAALLAAPAVCVLHTAWAAGFFCGLASTREARWAGGVRLSWRRAAERPAMTALLVDPSRFTIPYDAQLSEGLAWAGVRPVWATRPVRDNETEELPLDRRVLAFYRYFDRAEFLPGMLRKPAKALAHLAGLARLPGLARRLGADVIHFQWTLLPLFDALAIALLRLRRPVLLTVHDSIPFNGHRLSLLQTFAYDFPMTVASHLIVHTARARDALVARGHAPTKVSVIPHGPLFLKDVSTVPPRTDPRWTFVMFGQLKPYKGLDVLVEAIGMLHARLQGRARFVIAGAARMEMAEILRRIQELRLDDVLELRLEFLSNAALHELMQAADCFVFPYRQIDASGAYYLAKPLAKWIVASQVGVFGDDLIDSVSGTLVRPEDAAGLAAALLDALEMRRVPRGDAPDSTWNDIGTLTADRYRALAARARVRVGDDALPIQTEAL
jgi:succinoglycan biosynthesis protein ExoA